MKTPTPSEQAQKASRDLTSGGIFAFVGGVTFIIAFASPYWLQSYHNTFSNFKKMGLWEMCFQEFRFPYYQFDKKFNGCYYVFSEEYQVVRERLLPGWLITVQALMSVAVIPSFLCQIILSLVVMRFPLFLMRYQWILIGTATLCALATAPLIFLAVIVFASCVWTRDWLPMNPLWNYLSWSYAFAWISMILHLIAAWLLYKETKRARESWKREQNLVMQMHPQGYNGYM